MTNPILTYILEERAAIQRERMHESVQELRSTVRKRLDVQKAAAIYVWPFSVVAGLAAFALGYLIAGAFRD